MNHNPYMTRAQGATVTVFVPYDCNNHCPFCINKAEYTDTSNFSIKKIIESIRLLEAVTPFCDFVFTGGEPLADTMKLQQMLDVIPETHRIFINTTLPVSESQSETDIVGFFEKNKKKISCVNVSRHMQKYVVESNDSLLEKLPVPFRINCVLYKNYPAENIPGFLERWRKLSARTSVQFRFDYTCTTPDNLYDRENDPIFNDLFRISRYTGLDGCRMRCGFHFLYKDLEITYHKTLPYSTITITNPQDKTVYDVLYDVVIKQTGEIHGDWTGIVLDTEAYKNVKFEPDDNVWIEKI